MELGEVIGKMVRFDRYQQEMHEDINRWHAPSECHDLQARAADREWDLMMEEFEKRGWTSERIKLELKARGITEKWLYEHGIHLSSF